MTPAEFRMSWNPGEAANGASDVLHALFLSFAAGVSGYGVIGTALRLKRCSAATCFSFWYSLPIIVTTVFAASALASLRPGAADHRVVSGSAPFTSHSATYSESPPVDGATIVPKSGRAPAWPSRLSRFDRVITALTSQAAAHDGAIIAIWLIGAGVGAARLATSLISVVRLRQKLRFANATPLANLLPNLQIAGITDVPVIETNVVNLPTTVGFISPLILLPRGYRRSLEYPELHLVLTHEYAHILRNDFWTALVSEVLCVVFWFNPGVQLALVHMRLERECACDDFALRASAEDPRSLAHVLWRLAMDADLTLQATSTPGIAGIGARLVLRIERLLAHTHHPSNAHPAAVRLIIVIALSIAAAGAVFSSPGRSSAKNSPLGQIFPMTEVRSHHIAVRLLDGTVLLAGGLQGKDATTAHAELFDPVTRTFRAIAAMHSPRYDAAAALLPNGSVLIAGGWIGQRVIATAELYDPTRRTFVSIDSMNGPRGSAETVELSDGRVLIVGGQIANGTPLRSAEIFYPSTARFIPTGSMLSLREVFAAVRLKDGRVLVTGGSNGTAVLASAEIYDPHTGQFAATGQLRTPRMKHSATLLPDGRVLITGGVGDRSQKHLLRSVEFFLPAENEFVPGPPMIFPRFKHEETTVALRSGDVLVVGGAERAELFDSGLGRFEEVQGPEDIPRHYGAATQLADGTILVTGGYVEKQAQSRSAALYTMRSGQVLLGALSESDRIPPRAR